MKARAIFVIIILFSVKLVAAQQTFIDSLKQEFVLSKNDTTKILLLERISTLYAEINPDSSFFCAEKALALTKKLDLKLEEIVVLGEMGYALLNLGNYPRSLQTLLSGIAIGEDVNSEKNVLPATYPATDDFTDRSLSPRMQRLTKLSRTLQYAGILYSNSGNPEKSLYYHRAAIPLAMEAKNLRVLSIIHLSLGRTFLALEQNDSALLSFQKANDYAVRADYKRYLGSITLNLGRVFLLNGDGQKAKEYFQKALTESVAHNYYRGVVATHLMFAEIYKQTGNEDSSLYHIRSGLAAAYTLNTTDLLLRCYIALADFYNRSGNSDSTVKFQSFIIKINDSLFNSKRVQQFQNIDFDAQQQQQTIRAAKREYQDRMQKYLLLAGLAVFLLVAVFLWRSNRQRQQSNAMLQRQNKEIETAMYDLKTTQAQLVQSEKMASLGELTAGIAHEIQNPLNFVNNFSEINTELIEELEQEAGKGNMDEVKAIVKDIRENEGKINYHGKRADAIVKGMLQHSRIGSGQKELTDINALIDEYLRLAYHGLKAKNKSFYADFKTDFDNSIGAIYIVPHDIGRALLNIINNAFYAVYAKALASADAASEKQKQGAPGYQPTVTAISKKLADAVQIIVADNGNGIPQNIIDKIFQPFFTTKPTGQGTGLGLSLSYDIITKGHGGSLQVQTKEGEFAKFTITLPVHGFAAPPEAAV